MSTRATIQPALLSLLLAGCPVPPAEPPPPGEATAGSEAEPLLLAAEPELDVDLRITFIDVGQGDCTLIECGDSYEIVVDCGSTARGPGGRRRADVAELLSSRIDGELEVLVVTPRLRPHQLHRARGRRRALRA